MVFFDDEVRILQRFISKFPWVFPMVFPISCLILSQLNGKHTIINTQLLW